MTAGGRARAPRCRETGSGFQTPYLTIHNDEDDAVPWYQGIEFSSAMRRLGKEACMFVYNGEAHGLRNRDNQKH